MRFRLLLAGLILVFLPNRFLLAQGNSLQSGIQAYQDLEFQQAARILNGIAFDRNRAADERVSALTYLGAANVFLGEVNGAQAAFHELLVADPHYRPDQIVFPPEVTTFFEDVRNDTRVVRTVIEDSLTVVIGRDSVRFSIVASTPHDVVAELHFADSVGNEVVQMVYSGPVATDDNIVWDPATTGSEELSSPVTWLSVASMNASGREERRSVTMLAFSVTRPDTLMHPFYPSGDFLPERESPRRGPALLAGIVGGAVIAMAPSVASPGTQLNGARYAIAGSIGVAAVIGLVRPPEGKLLPVNVAANSQLTQRRQQWQAELDRVLSENQRLRTEAHLTVRPDVQILSEAR